MAMAPKISISGELSACASTTRRLARNSRLAAAAKRAFSHPSMPKAFTMRLPVMVSCKMFWISASLSRSEEHTSELQSPYDLVCRLLLEKKKKKKHQRIIQRIQSHDYQN